MLNSLGLGFLFKAKDETKETIERLHSNLENLKKAGEGSSRSITANLGISGKAIAGMALAVGAVATAAAFEFAEHSDRLSLAISEAGAASHATAQQVRELEEVARAKGMDSLYFSSIAAAESLRDLAKYGMSAKESTQALDGTLDLLRITMGAMTSTDAAGTIHDTLKQFGMEASKAGELTDKLAFAMRQFGFQATDLRPAMAGLASGAALTGASLDDTLIGVGLIHQAFPQATRAAMALNMAMQQVAMKSAQKELRGIGVTVTDASGKILPFIDIIQQLNNKTSKMTDLQIASKLALISGSRGAGGLTAVIDGLRKGITGTNGEVMTGATAIAYLRDQMAHTNGTAKAMADMLGTTMGDSITALKNAISNLGVVIGSGFEGTFKNAIQTANLFVRGITQLFTQGGFSGEVKEALDKRLGLKGFVVGVFMWIERIKNFFSSLSESFSATFAPFRPILDQLVSTFKELGRALGITSQSAGENASVWDTFGSAGSGVGSILANLAGTVLPVLVTMMQVVVGAVGMIREAITTLGPTLRGVWQAFQGVFGLIGGLLTGDWKKMWDGFIDVVVGAAKAVVRLVLGAMGTVGGIIDKVGAAFGQDYGLQSSIAGLQANMNSGAIERGTEVLKSVVAPSAPAAAATTANAEQSRAAAAQLAKMFPSLEFMNPDKELHVHTHVNLDGEKIATASARAKRDRGSRSFHAVPATEGAY